MPMAAWSPIRLRATPLTGTVTVLSPTPTIRIVLPSSAGEAALLGVLEVAEDAARPAGSGRRRARRRRPPGAGTRARRRSPPSPAARRPRRGSGSSCALRQRRRSATAAAPRAGLRSASGFVLRVRSGSLLVCTSFCIAVFISDGIAKMPTLATAIASVSTVKTVRALRRVRSVTDFLRSADVMAASSLLRRRGRRGSSPSGRRVPRARGRG